MQTNVSSLTTEPNQRCRTLHEASARHRRLHCFPHGTDRDWIVQSAPCELPWGCFEQKWMPEAIGFQGFEKKWKPEKPVASEGPSHSGSRKPVEYVGIMWDGTWSALWVCADTGAMCEHEH